MVNNGFISQTYLDHIIRKSNKKEAATLLSRISVFFEDVRSFVEGRVKREIDLSLEEYIDDYILSVLGGLFNYSEIDYEHNKFHLFSDSSKTLLTGTLLALHFSEDLTDETKGKNYGYSAVKLAMKEGVRWAFLTNGLKWRLYDAHSVSPYETYIEADLTKTLLHTSEVNEDTIIFCTFFLSRTFFINPDLDRAQIDIHFEKSEKEIEKTEKILKDKIEKIITDISYGFIQSIGKEEYTESERKRIFEDSIILLYRMLFIHYAESRSLFPIDNEIYQRSSFNALVEKARELYNSGELANQVNDYTLWEQLDNLRGYINTGWDDIDMKAYNGGLFDNEHHNILKNYSIPNSYFAEVLSELSFIKDKSGKFVEHINYKDLSVRNLGSLYEGLLEFNLFIAVEPLVRRTAKGKVTYVPVSETQVKQSERNSIIQPGRIYLSQDALERKESGSYYTPEDVVNYIISNTVGKKLKELKDEFDVMLDSQLKYLVRAVTESEKKAIQRSIDGKIKSFIEDRVLSISVIDSAMGSGHFLVNAVYFISNFIMDLVHSTKWENSELEGDISYWKTKVVSHCIFGIDLNPLAVHLGKLSLWLISAAKNKPLSFVDHHLKVGNSLIGIKKELIEGKLEEWTKGEFTLFTASYRNVIEDALDKYRKIKNMPEDTRDQVHEKKDVYDEISKEINLLKRKYDIFLAMLLKEDDAIEKEDILSVLHLNEEDLLSENLSSSIKNYLQYAESNNFFHWELEFPDIFSKDGFDIVIGNPPYVVSFSSPYRYSLKRTLTTGNLYSYMMERGIQSITDHGYFGMIVPISSVSGDTMASLQNYLLSNLSKLFISNYSTRPSKLFPKVEQRLSIIHGQKMTSEDTSCDIFTTSYLKWFSNERSKLFKELVKYSPCARKHVKTGVIPKIGNNIENSIFEKVTSKESTLETLTVKTGPEKVYYHSAPRYWNKAMDYLPKYYSEKTGLGVSSKYKPIYFSSMEKKVVFGSIFNSSLFYWWWNVVSDCRDLTKRDILNFPFNFEELSEYQLEDFKTVFNELMENYQNNKLEITMNLGGSTGVVTLESVNHQLAKPTVDKIDKLLAEYFCFTDEELNFIINYDFRFRMGNGCEDFEGEE